MAKLILIIIFFAGFFLGGLFLVEPLYEDYSFQVERNEVLEEELENLSFYIEALEKIEEKIDEFEEEIDVLESAFPEDHDAPALFLYLDDMIEKNNLRATGSFGDFSSEEFSYNESEHDRIKEVSFSLSLVGDYEQIKGFFADIEKSARIIRTNEVSIVSGDEDSFGGDQGFPAEGEDEEDAQERDDLFNIEIKGNTYSY